MADLNCGYQDTPPFDTETKTMQSGSYSADHNLTKNVTDLFDKLYHQPDATRLIGIRFSDSKECAPTK
jgi:hypothetical protein